MKIIANLIKVGNVLEHKGKKFNVLNTNTIKPDRWVYSDENIMNGGDFGGIWRDF